VAEQRAGAVLDPDDPLTALADFYGRTLPDLAAVLIAHRPGAWATGNAASSRPWTMLTPSCQRNELTRAKSD
jgi:hypothetical protein